MRHRHNLTRAQRLAKSQAEWAKYGPAILELMDRLEALKKEAEG